MIFEEFIKKANIGYPDIFTNLLQRKFRGGKQSFCGSKAHLCDIGLCVYSVIAFKVFGYIVGTVIKSFT